MQAFFTWYVKLFPPPVGIRTKTSQPLIVALITSLWLGRKEWFPNTFLLLAWEWKYVNNHQDDIHANKKLENNSDKHLQLLCPWEVLTTPLFVIRTFNIINFNVLRNIRFPLQRAWWNIKSIYRGEWIPPFIPSQLIIQIYLGFKSHWRLESSCLRCFILKWPDGCCGCRIMWSLSFLVNWIGTKIPIKLLNLLI